MNRKKLIEMLKDPEYRKAFVSAQVRRTVSTQIKTLRSSKGHSWTQKELGEKANMKQNAIARIENPNYGEYSIRTLLRLAEAFDVGLVVRLAPFSEIVDINQTATTERYAPASFRQDAGLSEPIESVPSIAKNQCQSVSGYRESRTISPEFIPPVEQVATYNPLIFPPMIQQNSQMIGASYVQ